MRRVDLKGALADLGKSRLAQFLLIGLLLWVAMPSPRSERRVVVDAARIGDALRAEQARVARPLTDEEKQRVMGELVTVEVLLREGLRLGVGVGDEVVRGRVADRMRASLEASVPAPVSNEEAREEAARLAAAMPARVLLATAFVSKDRPSAAGEADALARALAATPDARPPFPGDRPPLEADTWWTEADLARAAGPLVARAAMITEVGAWSAPVASAWGFYVLRPLARRAPTAEESLATGLASVRRKKRAEAVARAAARLAADYDVAVESPAGEPRFDPRSLAAPGSAARREGID